MTRADTLTTVPNVVAGMSLPVVSATGHRIQHFEDRPKLAAWVQHHLGRAAVWLRDQCGTHTALTGMAGGSDLWWGTAAHRAGLRLGAHVPCPKADQTAKWRMAQKREWEDVFALCDPELYVCAGPKYHVRFLHMRNSSMLNASAALIAVWDPDHRYGGTYSALWEARRMRLPGIWLNTRDLTIHFQLPDLKAPSDQLTLL